MKYGVELTEEAYRSCRRKPSAILYAVLLTMKEGDELEVVGEELLYPMDQVVRLLREAGLRVLEAESDGVEYRVRAVKGVA